MHPADVGGGAWETMAVYERLQTPGAVAKIFGKSGGLPNSVGLYSGKQIAALPAIKIREEAAKVSCPQPQTEGRCHLIT